MLFLLRPRSLGLTGIFLKSIYIVAIPARRAPRKARVVASWTTNTLRKDNVQLRAVVTSGAYELVKIQTGCRSWSAAPGASEQSRSSLLLQL